MVGRSSVNSQFRDTGYNFMIFYLFLLLYVGNEVTEHEPDTPETVTYIFKSDPKIATSLLIE